jgi:hypothetical protein
MAETRETRTIRATFGSRERAARTADRIRRQGFESTIDAPADERAVLRAEMRDEVESAIAGPGNVGPFTKRMTRGIIAGVPVAALIGAVLGALLGLLPWGFGLSFFLRVVLGVAIGAFGGAVVGFMLGGFVKPHGDDVRRLDAEAGSIVSVRTSTPEESRRVREFLESGNPLRIDEAADGVPVGPSSEEKAKPVRGD